MTGDFTTTITCPTCHGDRVVVDFNYEERDCATCYPFGGYGWIEVDGESVEADVQRAA